MGPKSEQKRLIELSKVKNIISAIEQNIKLGDVDPKDSEDNKKQAVNVFQKLMSSKGGEISPSPGKTKKKRLERVKLHGQKSIDGWLKKEK